LEQWAAGWAGHPLFGPAAPLQQCHPLKTQSPQHWNVRQLIILWLKINQCCKSASGPPALSAVVTAWATAPSQNHANSIGRSRASQMSPASACSDANAPAALRRCAHLNWHGLLRRCAGVPHVQEASTAAPEHHRFLNITQSRRIPVYYLRTSTCSTAAQLSVFECSTWFNEKLQC
jgi:hypothetical protein